MTIFEMIEFNKHQLDVLMRAGIKVSDVKYIELFNDYLEMVNSGEKITYIVTCLSERYHVCVRTVYNVTKKFKRVQEVCSVNRV